MSRLSIILVALVLAGFCVSSLTAQENSAKSASENLAIEVVGREHGRPWPVSSSGDGYAQIRPVPARTDWKPAKDTIPLTGIRIRSITEQDGVRIKIAAIFDDSEPADTPGPKYGEKEESIASYFAQEGDTVTVNEMERFGFKALLLRVVKYQPPPVAQPGTAVLPELVNNLKSVAFVDLSAEAPSSHVYRLSLQNLAAKNIVALAVHIPPNTTQNIEGSRKKPLMAPGATFQTLINAGQDDVASGSRSTFVIETVLFDDGSYEGNVVSAAAMAARRKGGQLQFQRLLEMLQETLGRADQDTSIVIQELKAGVTKFRIDVDQAVLEELRLQFPSLPNEKNKPWLASRIMEGLKFGRGRALNLLNDLEKKRARNPKSFDLNQSLSALRERVLF